MEQLLSTKFYIPPARLKLVSRPRLVERINDGLHCKLTLISAPAGFGKTTLVSEWVERLQAQSSGNGISNNAVAWLSLDENDNDPARFLAYLTTAFRQAEGIDPAFGGGALSLLQTSQAPPTETILTSLINDLATISFNIILVLDDYHLISHSAIDNALTFLIEHLPPQLHLIITTREDPQLPLARLRAGGHLNELRATDLRFTPPEAEEFLNQIMELELSGNDIATLETRTEGWVAGLQLAAISMQGREDASDLIKSFTGSHHLVLDYLIEEVMNQQSESLKSFLLQTAILDRMTGPLCDALTGQENGQKTLEDLERANLFIVPLDNERCWYRYHHLFSNLLRSRLVQSQPDTNVLLHTKASKWFEQNKFIEEAIEHAFRSRDIEQAANMVEKYIDNLWRQGEHIKLSGWLNVLPIELVFSKPLLCITHAMYQFNGGRLDLAERSLEAAEMALSTSTNQLPERRMIDRNRLSETDKMKIRGRAATIKAFIASYRGDLPEIIKQARLALDCLPEQDLTWRSSAAIVLGDSYALSGNLTTAYQVRLEALRISQAAGDIYLVIIANLKLAITLRITGQLRAIADICQQQMAFAEQNGMSQIVVVGWLSAIWGEVLAEFNRLDEALHKTQIGVELTKGGGEIAMLSWSYLCMIRVLFSRKDYLKAEEIIHKFEETARESNMPHSITNLIAYWKIRIWLAQDKLEAAVQLAKDRGLAAEGNRAYLNEMEYIAFARIFIAQEKIDEATNLLQHLLREAEAGGRTSRVIEILILQTLASEAGGNTNLAMTTLEKALSLAEPGGFMRVFVDEDPPIAPLLYKALDRGIAKEYISRLLAVFQIATPQPMSSVVAQIPTDNLFDPLTNRECEVLQLIAEGLTNQEIAKRLFLSTNTVKVHTRNIFGKLNVNNRTQAVTRAKALGILTETEQ